MSRKPFQHKSLILLASSALALLVCTEALTPTTAFASLTTPLTREELVLKNKLQREQNYSSEAALAEVLNRRSQSSGGSGGISNEEKLALEKKIAEEKAAKEEAQRQQLEKEKQLAVQKEEAEKKLAAQKEETEKKLAEQRQKQEKLSAEIKRIKNELADLQGKKAFVGNDLLKQMIVDYANVLQLTEKLSAQAQDPDKGKIAQVADQHKPNIDLYQKRISDLIQEGPKDGSDLKLQNDLMNSYSDLRTSYLSSLSILEGAGINPPPEFYNLPADILEQAKARLEGAMKAEMEKINEEQAQKEAEDIKRRKELPSNAKKILDFVDTETKNAPYLKKPEPSAQYAAYVQTIKNISNKNYLEGKPYKIDTKTAEADQKTLVQAEAEIKKIFEHWKKAQHPENVTDEQVKFAEELYQDLCGSGKQISFNTFEEYQGPNAIVLAHLANALDYFSIISPAYATDGPTSPDAPMKRATTPPPSPNGPAMKRGGPPPTPNASGRGGPALRGGMTPVKRANVPDIKGEVQLGDIYSEEYGKCVKELKKRLPNLLDLFHPLALGDVTIDQYKEYVKKISKNEVSPQDAKRVEALEKDMTQIISGKLDDNKTYGYFLLASAWRSEADAKSYPFTWTDTGKMKKALTSYVNQVGMRFSEKIEKELNADDQSKKTGGSTDDSKLYLKDNGAAIFFPTSKGLRELWLNDPFLKNITGSEANLSTIKVSGGGGSDQKVKQAKQVTYQVNTSIANFLELFDIEKAAMFLKNLPATPGFPKDLPQNVPEKGIRDPLTAEQATELIKSIKESIEQKIKDAKFEPFNEITVRSQKNDQHDIDGLAFVMIDTVAAENLHALQDLKEKFIKGEYTSNIELQKDLQKITEDPITALLEKKQKVIGRAIAPDIRCFDELACPKDNQIKLDQALEDLKTSKEHLALLKEQSKDQFPVISKKYFLSKYPKDETAVEKYYTFEVNDSKKIVQAVNNRFDKASALLRDKLASSISKFVKTYPDAVSQGDAKLSLKVSSFFSIAEGIHFPDYDGTTLEFIILHFALKNFADIPWRDSNYFKAKYTVTDAMTLSQLKEKAATAEKDDQPFIQEMIKRREKNTIVYRDHTDHPQEFRLDQKPYNEGALKSLKEYLVKIKPLAGHTDKTYDDLVDRLEKNGVDLSDVKNLVKSPEDHIKSLEGVINGNAQKLTDLDTEINQTEKTLEELVSKYYKPYENIKINKPLVSAYVKGLRPPYRPVDTEWKLSNEEEGAVIAKLSPDEKAKLETLNKSMKPGTTITSDKIMDPGQRAAKEKHDHEATTLLFKKAEQFVALLKQRDNRYKERDALGKKQKALQDELANVRKSAAVAG